MEILQGPACQIAGICDTYKNGFNIFHLNFQKVYMKVLIVLSKDFHRERNGDFQFNRGFFNTTAT